MPSSGQNSPFQRGEVREEPVEWKPDLIILISGKRKSGKTFLSEKLFSHLLDTEFNLNEIILAGPLKEIYAKENGLDYERLLDTSSYKELHRVDMIKWSDSKRVEDLYFFCKIAVGKVAYDLSMKVKNKLNIWVVTDLRLQVELQYFKLKYSNLIKTVRVLASDEVRIQRNWVFTKGADDWSSECDLDMVDDWDFVIRNDNDKTFNRDFEVLVNHLKELTA